MEKIIKNAPHVVVGHTSIPIPKLSIVMKVGGLREIIKELDDDDMVRYEAWSDISEKSQKQSHYEQWTIVL